MRDPKRIPEILNRLKAVWTTYSDLRLGQLILNVTNDPFLYYVEDEDLIRQLEELYFERGEEGEKDE